MKKETGHWVLLDPRTLIGSIYARGSNDGTCEHSDAPFLYCTEITMDSPIGVSALRPLPNGSYTSLVVPYAAIAGIWNVHRRNDFPFGFVPPKKNPSNAI